MFKRLIKFLLLFMIMCFSLSVDVKAVTHETGTGISFTIVGEQAKVVGCKSSIKDVKIPASVELDGVTYDVVAIGENAFENSYITSVEFPATLTDIGNSSFKNCPKLATITFSDGLSSIGEEAFRGCVSLSSVVLPNTTKFVGYRAFYGCISLKEVELNRGLCTLSGEAFSGTALTSIRVYTAELEDCPYSYENNGPFSGCDNLTEVSIDSNSGRVPCYLFAGAESVELVNFLGKGITSIGGWAFSGCTNLRKVILPSSLKEIEYRAFENCTSLESLELPDSLEKIDESFKNSGLTKVNIPVNFKEGSFSDCKLTTVWIDEGLKNLPDSIFYNCDELTEVSLPNSLRKIGNNAFDSCDKLKSVHLNDNLYSIGYGAFMNCTSLEVIDLPSFTTVLGEDAFRGCISLKSIRLSTKLDKIPVRCFYDCFSLLSVELPDTVKYIQDNAFENCFKLESINLENVETIGNEAFRECNSLKEVNFSDKLRSLGESSFRGTSIAQLVLPDSINEVPDGSFIYCNQLEDIKWGNAITVIGDSAFYGCGSLRDIVLPNSVKTIKAEAFYSLDLLCGGDVGLTSLYIPPTTSTIEDSIVNIRTKIYGASDSEAKAYAEECGLSFEAITTPATSVKITHRNLKDGVLKMNVQSNEVLGLNIEPAMCTDKVTWSVDDSYNLKLNDGVLTSYSTEKEFKVTVTVGSVSDTITVKTELMLNDLVFSHPCIDLSYIGETSVNVGIPNPLGYGVKHLTEDRVYLSEDENVAIIDNYGNITATGYGTTTIKMYYKDYPDIVATSTVTVHNIKAPTFKILEGSISSSVDYYVAKNNIDLNNLYLDIEMYDNISNSWEVVYTSYFGSAVSWSSHLFVPFSMGENLIRARLRRIMPVLGNVVYSPYCATIRYTGLTGEVVYEGGQEEETTDNIVTEEPSGEVPSEEETTEPQEESTTEKPLEEETTSKEEESTTEKPSEEETTEKPSEEETTSKEEESTTEKPSEEETTEKQSDEETTSKEEESTTEKPSEEETTSKEEETTSKEEESTTERPSEEESTERPSTEEPSEEESSTEEPTTESPRDAIKKKVVKTVLKKDKKGYYLEWNDIEVEGYEVNVWDLGRGSWTKLASVGDNTRYYLPNKFKPGRYCFVVQGYVSGYVNYILRRFYSKYEESSVLEIKPESVTSVKQKSLYTNKIELTWGKVSNITGYEIYKATTKNAKYTKVLSVTGLSGKFYVSGGTSYWIKVRAYKSVDGKKVYGAFSEPIKMYSKPSTPTIKLSKVVGTKIKVSWNKSVGANSYDIYMSTSKSGTYKLVTTRKSTHNKYYTVSNLKKGKTYYFKVRTYKLDGSGNKIYSNWSNVKSLKLPR